MIGHRYGSKHTIEEGLPNDLIFTFFILMHGATIEQKFKSVFNDCVMFSKTGSLCYSYDNSDETIYHDLSHLKEKMQKNLETFTYDTLDECIVSNIQPKYKKEIPDCENEIPEKNYIINKNETNQMATHCFKPVSIINFDKALIRHGDYDHYGIFLISVHEKISDDEFKYIKVDDSEKVNGYDRMLNLLNMDDLVKFSNFFGGVVPEMNSAIFTKNMVPKNWSGIHLNEDRTFILSIRMSKFVEIIKNILQYVGKKIKINLIDYSCSKYYANNSLTCEFPGSDIENFAIEHKFGGKRKNKTKRKIRKNVKKVNRKMTSQTK